MEIFELEKDTAVGGPGEGARFSEGSLNPWAGKIAFTSIGHFVPMLFAFVYNFSLVKMYEIRMERQKFKYRSPA